MHSKKVIPTRQMETKNRILNWDNIDKNIGCFTVCILKISYFYVPSGVFCHETVLSFASHSQ